MARFGSVRYLGYLGAPAAVVAATLLRLAMTPVWGDTRLPFLFYFPAVALAAWLGGRGPGVLALLLSVPAAYFFFVTPVRTITIPPPEDALGLISFAAIGLLIVYLADAEKLATRRAEAAAQALAQSEERMGTTLNSIGDAVLVTDEHGMVTMMNPVAEALTGWQEGEAKGKAARLVFDLFSEETGQEVESPVACVLKEGGVVGLADRTVLRRRDGSKVPIDDSGAPIRDADGNLTGVVVVFRDITERKRAEAEQQRLHREQDRLLAELQRMNERQRESLSDSEERFKLLVEGVQDYAIFMLDPEGNVATWNAGAERFKGYTAGEIIGKHFSVFYTEEDIQRRHPWNELEVARREGRYEEEGWRVRKDGSRFWASVVITALRDEAGELRGFAKVTRDFTERREAERAERERERQSHIAERLQAALRPALPGTVSGLEMEVHYQPAFEELVVGGDFFDVFAVEKGCYALVVADLSGKGLEAAAQTATVRHMLRALLYHKGTTVAGAVTGLNEMLAENDLLSGFATLFAGAYDANARTLTYVNAGQEPGLLWRAATGTVEQLIPTGPVLGGFGGAAFTERVVSLASGDVLALFTDGLTEAGRSRKDLLGVEGVAALFQASCAESAEEVGGIGGAGLPPSPGRITARMMAGVVEQATPAGIRDDVCLLVARVQGAGG